MVVEHWTVILSVNGCRTLNCTVGLHRMQNRKRQTEKDTHKKTLQASRKGKNTHWTEDRSSVVNGLCTDQWTTITFTDIMRKTKDNIDSEDYTDSPMHYHQHFYWPLLYMHLSNLIGLVDVCLAWYISLSILSGLRPGK